MTGSPDAWPHRAEDTEDVFLPPAMARPEQGDPKQRDAEQADPDPRDDGQVTPDQADPDLPDDGWEPV